LKLEKKIGDSVSNAQAKARKKSVFARHNSALTRTI